MPLQHLQAVAGLDIPYPRSLVAARSQNACPLRRHNHDGNNMWMLQPWPRVMGLLSALVH
eukprot:29757-Eustigmatos_ZCMA.PRE.1